MTENNPENITEELVPAEEMQALEHVDQNAVGENPYTADDFDGEQDRPDEEES